MRRARPIFAALVVVLALAGVAIANSTTVQGTGDIKKMVVNNGERAVTVKLFGFDAPCEAHYFKVLIYWGKRKAYQADAGCYQAEWIPSLYYYPNRNKPENNASAVGCEKFKVAYNKDRGFYRVFVPRKCLSLAPDKIRVRASGDNYASTTGGEAGPTAKLPRG